MGQYTIISYTFHIYFNRLFPSNILIGTQLKPNRFSVRFPFNKIMISFILNSWFPCARFGWYRI